MPTESELTTRLDSDLRKANIPIDGVSGIVIPYNPATVRVSPSNIQSQAQSIIDAFDASQAAQDAWLQSQNQDQANAFMVALDEHGRSYRAVAAILVDEINILREWIVSFQAATAAATSLADLKTRVAGLPDLPDRTMTQAKSAFKTKVNSNA